MGLEVLARDGPAQLLRNIDDDGSMEDELLGTVFRDLSAVWDEVVGCVDVGSRVVGQSDDSGVAGVAPREALVGLKLRLRRPRI
jgi:hypothetical protein